MKIKFLTIGKILFFCILIYISKIFFQDNSGKLLSQFKNESDFLHKFLRDSGKILNTVEHEPLESQFSYLDKYKDLLDCSINYKFDDEQNYNLAVPKEYEDVSVTRAILLYFPIEKFDHFFIEFKWLYRSWIEMQTFEPKKWRTDILVFIDNNKFNSYKDKFEEFNQMNCSFDNIRTNKNEKPMCSLISFQSVYDRNIETPINNNAIYSRIENEYIDLYRNIDLFNDTKNFYLDKFLFKLKDISHYRYIDSILMGFEAYNRTNGIYDFLLRSDMDVFLTPLFAKWLPRKCNDFIVGGGGYSTQFNRKRLGRIASNLKLEYADTDNVGSTWYTTPKQTRVLSFLTLLFMTYISNEEFTSVERKGELGVKLWPEWHYGVLLLYGQNIAMNHLIATNEIHIVKLPELFDFPSGNEKSVFESVHIHVFHGGNLFSKFRFRDGAYANMTVSESDKYKTKYYALRIALDAKKFTPKELYELFSRDVNKVIH